ncbi:MAG TPA: thymidine phosphorylase, partial [Ignavibacteriaceae bacterium]|nr:thymidine phosphorylase [Ignavibacteriaceae bacterium]
IRKKRLGQALTQKEIQYMTYGFTQNKIPDYQFSAFLMAVYFRGMTREETSFLTDAMLNSGKIIDLKSFKGFKVDKHSTGGVGDKTSLILAPIAAAAGLYVPMISGRGLGHTGGTLDKLESIPGFRTDLSLIEFKSVLKKTGAALIGQTKEIAPADKVIYSLRDVTATIESVPLITASIMSKKLAEGIDGLVLDVKTGNGAFMKTMKETMELTDSLVKTAKSFNKKVMAFITDMNQPLGTHIGNWLEVVECINILREEVKNDVYRLSTRLAGAMIYHGGKAESIDAGTRMAKEIIKDGRAYNKFIEIVKAQGGDVSYIQHPEKYSKSKYMEKLFAHKSGYVYEINTYEIGMASIELGAGRKTKEETIDYKAGIILNFKIGDKINKGDIISELYSDSKEGIKVARERFSRAISIKREKPQKTRLIKKIIL